MEKQITLDELNIAFVYDCYNSLISNSDENTLASIKRLLASKEGESERNKIISVVESSIYDEDPENFEYKSAVSLTKQYIANICKRKRNVEKVDIAQICLFYVAIFGYRYTFRISEKSELFEFKLDNYDNFSQILDYYSIKNKISEYYQENVKSMKSDSDSQLIEKFMERRNESRPDKEVIGNKDNKSGEKVIFFKQVNENNSNIKDKNQIDNSIDSLKNEIALIKKQNSENEEKIKKELEEKIKKELEEKIKKELEEKMKKKISKLEENNLLLDFKVLETNEKLNIESICNSIALNAEKKKIEYLNVFINSLKNTIINLSNPYNFNLWRKLANILLKNLLLILRKKNFTIKQNINKTVFNQLKKLIKDSSFSDVKKTELMKKNDSRWKDNSKDVFETKTSASAADRERKYNLITIYRDEKPDIICSLSTEFLFFLKEKGNKADHFDETILDLVLFDNLNIIQIEKDEIKNEEQKVNEEDSYDNFNAIYNGKTLFKAGELIEMVKNPVKYVKEELDMDVLFKSMYERIDELKKKIGSENFNRQVNQLINEAKNIFSNNKKLMEEYEKENKTETNQTKDNNIEKEYSNESKISNLKAFERKINEKIEFYSKISDDIDDLVGLQNIKKQKIDKYITEIKKTIKNIAKTIKLDNIFQEFKNDLKNKIKNEKEYINHPDIFNDENIEKFEINKFFSFLEPHLNYNNTAFSIVKRDITNYNLYVEIINNFNELKDFYFINLDLEI